MKGIKALENFQPMLLQQLCYYGYYENIDQGVTCKCIELIIFLYVVYSFQAKTIKSFKFIVELSLLKIFFVALKKNIKALRLIFGFYILVF